MIARAFVFSAITACAFSSPAAADMVYKPLNPSFGGDSFNSSHLQTLATTQNSFNKAKSTNSQSPTDRFLSMLQSRLYSALASTVTEAIFGDDAHPSGTIIFDDQQVAYVNTGTEIQLVITDFSTGQVTNIVVPTLVTP